MGADLADMQLLSKFNQGIRFFLCVLDIYSKYAWVVPLKNKKGIMFTTAFQKILNESGRKPSKIWVDKVSEFYNRLIKSWLEKNDIDLYSGHNEEKTVVAERFITTSKNKICKYITSISKNIHIDRLDGIVNKYNNAFFSTIKVKPVDLKSSTCINFDKKNKKEGQKLKVGDHDNLFGKGYVPNWFEKVFAIKRVKNTVPWTYVIDDLNGEGAAGTFSKKELLKASRVESCKSDKEKMWQIVC